MTAIAAGGRPDDRAKIVACSVLKMAGLRIKWWLPDGPATGRLRKPWTKIDLVPMNLAHARPL